MTSAAIGLVVNPVAGVGGPAGLKGSDGASVQHTAFARGAVSRSGERAVRALRVAASAAPGLQVLTVAGAMGEDAARSVGLRADVVPVPGRRRSVTDGDDTAVAVRALAEAGATLILFVGGDGTARDVARGRPDGVAVLGVPAGVKMYSDCFAVSPSAAGQLAAAWVAPGGVAVRDAEVLDIDEEQLRTGRPEPRLFALVPVPAVTGRTQARKAATPASEASAVLAAARGVVAEMRPGVRYVLGPGGTVQRVAQVLGVEGTPLGVDVVQDGELVLRDGSEPQVRAAIRDHECQAVVTVIGGQGFLLGRGNQQISAAVVRALSEPPLLVVATEQKLIDLHGRPLLVDTGDVEVDSRLAGHVRVVTAPGRSSIYPVVAPEAVSSDTART